MKHFTERRHNFTSKKTIQTALIDFLIITWLLRAFNLLLSDSRCFVNELDLSGMAVDVALRRYQAHFRLPGEAQKIERLVEAFARRYCACNVDFVQRLRTQDTVRDVHGPYVTVRFSLALLW